ncbi:2TM domain-containing protein [Aurantibacter crassamenti]|uniref:2TM domain-containing protein n=1 Tax=Aurantibacter crassamenti TaxID=1837375 RepID=UPI00193A102B|nr:2TM domain-containing protein [Aurantibacter crassamenti]MBM1107655.1 2TM domain-containing protein [Aurantibacter crassamenti]
METNQAKKLKRAQRRVGQIKKFYKHLRIFIVVNILLLVFKFKAYEFFTEKGISDEGFLNWFEWNIIGTPVIWGIGLGCHAIYVFILKSKPLKELRPQFLKDWEERQIEKIMREDKNSND